MKHQHSDSIHRLTFGLSVMAAACAVGACRGDPTFDRNDAPGYLGSVKQTTYDGSSDDLLTAGLGKSGLQQATLALAVSTAVPGAVPFVDPVRPTAVELRRATVYNRYRSILDTTPAGGFGSLYGPNVTSAGVVTASEGKVAGTEYIAFSDDGSGTRNVTLMVQVPASFDVRNPCIISATASGSQGVYGALSTGEWGLKKGCAVAYTDKGTGTAPHDLQNDTVALIDGTRTTSAAAARDAAFRAPLSAAELAAFNAATPNRFAFKHAHSQQNPERDWGLYTLRAIEFAFYVVNQKYGDVDSAGRRLKTLVPGNTIVIASSVSNGGGAALAAAEQDTLGVIGGVAVAEPAVELPAAPGVSVKRGASTVAVTGKTLVDFTTLANLYQSCASLSGQLAGTPFQGSYVAGFGFFAGNRCASLKTKGLLTATTTAAQADEALQKLRDYGWEGESDALYASLASFEVAPAVSVTFANALSRASVKDNLCGYSYASTTAAGAINTLAPEVLAQLAAIGNGVPPSNGIQLINNRNAAGPLRDLVSASPSTGVADINVDGAICLRNLVTGSDAAALKLQAGVDETRRTGNLRGRPAIIVHGRADALLPVSHTSRPYYALNKVVERAASKLSYIEVTNAQHFDAFIGLPAVLPGYDSRYVPLHVYLNRALDAVYANLKSGTPLPASQVLRTVPRGGVAGAAPAITAANVPAIATVPAAADAISFSGTTVTIPD